jgi:hypothetical protein
MKMKYLIPMLCAVTLLAFNSSVRADDGEDGQGTNSCSETNDCNISGSESMDAVVVLQPTSNAPAGALGIAKIESDNEDGNEQASIDLKTFALTPGDYNLVISLAAEGTNVTIGQFTVSAGDGGDEDDQGGDDQGDQGGDQQDHMGFDWGDGGGWICCNWGGFTNWGSWTNWCDTNFPIGMCTNFPVVTRTSADLPPGINPTDISDISVTDTNGNTILDGNLTNPAPASVINISATVQVTPGVAAPSATGTAHIQSTAVKGKWTHKFTLNASGVPAKSTFKLNVNGKVSGAAKANKTGDVAVKKLPSHTPALRSMRLLDKKGNEAASAHF